MKYSFKWFIEISSPYVILFVGNLWLFYTIGNGLIIEDSSNDSPNGSSIGGPGINSNSTRGVIKFSNDFLVEFLIMLSVSTLIFYLLITKFRENGIKILFSFSLSFIYLSSLGEMVLFASEEGLTFTIGWFSLVAMSIFLSIFMIMFLYVFISSKKHLTIRNTGLLVTGLLAGRLIALYLDLASLIVISLILIVYDFWNVFRGPLTKLVGKPSKIQFVEPDELSKQTIIEQICNQGTPVYISSNQQIMTGLGDLFFFGALMYRSLMIWGFIGLVFTFTVIFIGLLLTLKILTHISPLPGLPIPVSFALISFLIMWYIGG
ncbi:MAG: hypothetical protein ACW99A_04905 [Candidatus Kariarchaeaceae archaeon]